MDGGDVPAVAALLSVDEAHLNDDFMVSLVAEWSGQFVALLRGWLGHPWGHIEVFEENPLASPRHRYQASVWLLRTFEGLLERVGAKGWTGMPHKRSTSAVKILQKHGAVIVPEERHLVMKMWR